MKFLDFIKGVLSSLRNKDRLKRIFQTDIITGNETENARELWQKIIKGVPPWSGKDDVESINFAAFLCSDIAKKICLDIDISITGSARADTRLEYHRFEGKLYLISNRAFRSKTDGELGSEIDLASVEKWANIQAEAPPIENIDKPLFAYFKMPYNNTIDQASPLGVSVFHNAVKELKDLDIAWSRKSGEIEDSKHITFLPQTAIQFSDRRKQKLPRFIQPIDIGTVDDSTIHEHSATLLTEQRIADINSVLSMISTKCGFSQGQFVLDRKTGAVTATQIESDDRETIETVKEMRDALKVCLDQLIYALSKYADLQGNIPLGEYEVVYNFGDLTYNYEEDRARHWNYVTSGKYPLWRYFVKFEGMSEEEAKQVSEEARSENTSKGLFE